MTDISNFEYETSTCPNLSFLNKFSIESWCNVYEYVNQISNHSLKSRLRSVISTDTSECVANVRFASVFLVLFLKSETFQKH